MKGDGVKDAFGGADAAADTLVGIHHRRAAAQAAGGFGLYLLLGEGVGEIPEGTGLGLPGPLGSLSVRVVVAGDENIVLVQLDKVPSVSPDGQGAVLLYVPVQGNRALPARRDGVDGEFGTGINVAAHEDVRLRCLICESVGLRACVGTKLHSGSLKHISPQGLLTNPEKHS